MDNVPAGVIPERAKIKPAATLLWKINTFTEQGQTEIRALVDTGADINAVSAEFASNSGLRILPRQRTMMDLNLKGAQGTSLVHIGTLYDGLIFQVPGEKNEILEFTVNNVLVLEEMVYPIILGLPFLEAHNLLVKARDRCLHQFSLVS
jgi:predicted aspartyl protease